MDPVSISYLFRAEVIGEATEPAFKNLAGCIVSISYLFRAEVIVEGEFNNNNTVGQRFNFLPLSSGSNRTT